MTMSPAAKAAFVKRMQSSRGGKAQSVSPARTPAMNAPATAVDIDKKASRIGAGPMMPSKGY